MRTSIGTAATRGISIFMLFMGAGCSDTSDNSVEPVYQSWLNPDEIDTQRNPCDNFYQYVNAKWIEANPLPPDQHELDGTFLNEKSLAAQRVLVESAAAHANRAAAGSPEQLVGYLYASGIDEARIEQAGYAPIKPELDKIAALKNTQDIVEYLIDTFTRGNALLFDIIGDADLKNAAMQIATVHPGGLGLPLPYYGYPGTSEAYQAYITGLLQLIDINVDSAKNQANQVWAFETRLAEVTPSRLEQADPVNRYHFVSIDEANRMMSNFDWEVFFKAQGADVKAGFSLSPPKFFVEINKMLTDVPVAHWQAYFRAHVLKNAAPYLSSTFQKKVRGSGKLAPRWKQVLTVVNDQLGQALGELYVKQYFSPQAKQKAQTLVDNLHHMLKARIENLDWMSDVTQQKALEKWRSLIIQVGYPDKQPDLSGLSLNAADYFSNIQAVLKFNHANGMSKIGKPTRRREWRTTPQTANAFYIKSKNQILLPAAALQPPYFSPQADAALNYGGIGAIIGHELLHAYDDSGSRFDANGNHANWWTEADRQAFDMLTEKLVKQFDAYSPLPGRYINGQSTLDENIADLSGTDLAYLALQAELRKNPLLAQSKIDGYSQNQRFFISKALVYRRNISPDALAQQLDSSHAPDPYRVIGPLSNLPSFAKAFTCKPGDAMVRPENMRVKIW